MSSAMQRAIALTSGSLRHDAAQWPQASAQALQASMQDLNCSWGKARSSEMKLTEQEMRSRPSAAFVDVGEDARTLEIERLKIDGGKGTADQRVDAAVEMAAAGER